MRIGIDARLIDWPGIGRYIRSLVAYLPLVRSEYEYFVYYNSIEEAQANERDTPSVKNLVFPYPVFSIQEHFRWYSQIRRDKLDVFHAPHYVVPLIRNNSSKLVVTIHDLIGFRYPEFLFSKTARTYYQVMTRLALRTAKACITDAEFTKHELVDILNVDPQKIYPIHIGVDTTQFSVSTNNNNRLNKEHNLPNQTILYLGTKKPWKNLYMLLEAFAYVVEKKQDVGLILAGKDAKHQQETSKRVMELGLSEYVYDIGFVSEGNIASLYRDSTLLAFPSYYEGFGLPVVEAMSCGLPVVASNMSTMPEVVGDAGILLDPFDPQIWGKAILTLLDDSSKRVELKKRGIERARRFSWEQCAKKTVAVYEALSKL